MRHSTPLPASPELAQAHAGPPHGPHTLVLRLPATSEAIADARSLAWDAAIECELDDTASYQFVYAVNEAVTNAVKHGTPDTQGMITLTVVRDPAVLSIAVGDRGRFSVTAEDGRSCTEGGRGLALMIALADSISVRSDDSGTTVTVCKCLNRTRQAQGPGS